jgi:hypothetical protein
VVTPNSCLLIDTAAMAHLPRPQNRRECHLYLAEGCHLYIAATASCRTIPLLRRGLSAVKSISPSSE